MIYVIDATQDNPSGWKPEIYDDLDHAVESVFDYNDAIGGTYYTIHRYNTIEDWQNTLEPDTCPNYFYDFTSPKHLTQD